MEEKIKNISSACKYAKCPTSIEPGSPYDEFSHEVDCNKLSVKVAKNFGKIKTAVSGFPDYSALSNVQAICKDDQGNKCRVGCAKLHVIPNKPAPAKQPDEESFVLRTTRQYIGPDEQRNSLEIELRTPKNYESAVLLQSQLSVCPDICSQLEDVKNNHQDKLDESLKRKKEKNKKSNK